MRRTVFLALLLAFPAAGQADEVFTRSGGHLTGEVIERGPQKVVLDIGIGRIELPLSYVERIVPGTAPITAFHERARALAPGDLAGWLALGRWAGEHELEAQAASAFEHALAIDPEDAIAQQALGRVRVDGRWMTREESYEARGLVPFEGGWVSPEERQAARAERAEAAARAREEADAQARVRETEARLREAEAQARMAEAQARSMEAEARAAEVNATAFPYPIVGGLAPYSGFAPSFGIPFQPAFPVSFRAACRRGAHVVGFTRSRMGMGAGVTPARRPVRPCRTRGCSR